jgi:GAF domain-containing protein/HAMP domain-containing protein
MNNSSAPETNTKPKVSFWPQSLRARLTLGSILIVFVSLAGMGYYVYYRVQEANTFITSRLEENARRDAEQSLATTGAEQAAVLNNFFASVGEDIRKIGTTTENLLIQENLLNNGAYWNAAVALARLPNGSWDNQNWEVASIFIPAQIPLSDSMVSELNVLKHTEFSVPPILASKPDIIAVYFGGVSKETVYFPNIDLAAIVPPDFDVTQRPWFIAAAPAQNPDGAVVWSAPYLDAALNGIVVTGSTPVIDSTGKFRGVAAMDIQLNRIAGIIANIRVGETGYAFLIDRENRLIALPPAGYADLGASADSLPLGDMIDASKLANVPAEFYDLLARIASGENGLTTLTVGGLERYVVYRQVPEVDYGLIIIVPSEEMLAEVLTVKTQVAETTRDAIALSILLVAFLLVAATIAALAMGNTLTAPLKALTSTAERITAGDLEAQASVRGQDEIGTLAKTLNTMTSTLRGLIQSLEQRVGDRTAELALANQRIQRRAGQFEAISLVARTIASIQNLDELLPRVTQLVSEDFGYYHVGIFLLDDARQFAILRAANSEGGRKMLERNHRLEVGQIGIVGFVADTGQSRIALDVGEDTVYFNNPDLPATRSEMALPLRLRGEIIGVLDVQSTEAGAFTESDADTLSIMADQIAIAIDNARLFGDSQRALTEIQTLYSQYLNQEWAALAKKETHIGYHRSLVDGREISIPVENDEIRQVLMTGELLVNNPEDTKTEGSIIMPIKLRNQVIGVVNIKTPSKGRRWSEEEVNMIRVISDRLALALENARLFEETTRTAEREKLVSDITTSIRSTNDPQAMIEMAVSELRRALGVSRVEIIPQRVASSEADR